MTENEDPVTEAPEAEAAREIAAEPVPVAPRRWSGRLGPVLGLALGPMLGPVLGGAIAAVAGFGLAQFDVFNLRPDPAPDRSAEIAALQDQLAKLSDTAGNVTALGEKLDALDARLAAYEARPAPDLTGLTALEDRLARIEALPAGDAASTAALAARLARIEAALQSQPVPDTAALQARLDTALARLGEAEAEAAARNAAAEAAAAKSTRDLALRALRDAVSSGQPFADKLQALADPALDASLGPMAASGAPTLAGLQAGFPDTARETLRLAREISPQDGWTDRLVDFLAVQTEARSLTPREGTGPDAILSRAEFALTEGRVADALAELATLDPALAAPLAVWTKAANQYVSAMAALAAAGGE